MKFDLLTYLFEIINFFILLWILKKLLYKPVISVLKKRKEYIDTKIREAEEAQAKVEKLKQEYEKLLQDIENIKKAKLAEITKQVEEEKEKLYKQMKAELDAEREKFLESLQIEKKEVINEIKEFIINYSLQFVSKILVKVSDENLHKNLFKLALEAIENLPDEDKKSISEELKHQKFILIETAYPLTEEEKNKLKDLIKKEFGIEVSIKEEEKKDLIAGVSIHIGSKLIDLSLEGQLSVFQNIMRKKIESY
ncbi:F0F1 ATP synthase subunit delta [Hydrogenothermus marinus]|uniref:Multifunctional fusion protein n=1 Tax=Hydrogenothermus marinus TaxID=133270 RepID=A0A3M0BQX7_9AQUI|nr:F0F1 ATP synthase subunit delta [Hydrogenothermus marinus]RMA97238.1 F-type H+-transporting ATPase subunit b [Hydrogenothermus marinus]